MRIVPRIVNRKIRAALAAGTVLAAAAGLCVSLASPAMALGAGEVCMFNAPTGAELGFGLNAGHVGWGYLIGGTSTWTFGATESPSYHWHTSGSWGTMLADFRNADYGHSAHYYTQYKCGYTPTSSVGAANTAVSNGEGSGYFALTNNCLTKSVAIFNAYYGFGLYAGWSEAPNAYFNGLGWYGPYGL
jgi:hypothetical protein